MDFEKIKKVLGIIWLVILVFLWVAYPYFPGDIFFWMWLAIIWSIIGGVVGTIFFMSESKKNEKIILLLPSFFFFSFLKAVF